MNRIAAFLLLALGGFYAPRAQAADPVPAPPAAAAPAPTQRYVGVVVAGVGIVEMGLGAVFRMVELNKTQDAYSHATDGPPQFGDARAWHTAAWLTFSMGAITTAAGVVIYLTAPKAVDGRVSITPILGGGVASYARSF